MKIHDARQEDLDIYPDKDRNKGDSNEWLISYSDLVTVLLCFFILFFVIKARQQEKDFLETIGKNGKKEMILVDVAKQLDSTNLTSKSQIQKFDRHLSLTFANKIFDSNGELTLDGQYFFTELASVIFPFMPSVQIQISIGEEKTNEKIDKILRIRQYLSDLGLNQELITIGSYSRSPASIEDSTEDEVRIFLSRNNSVDKNEK